MENQVIVRVIMATRTYLDAAPLQEQSDLNIGTIGTLTGLESHNSKEIAWVLWELNDCHVSKPVLADFVEVVGIRVGKHSVIVH